MKSAVFIKSSVKLDQCPKPDKPEFAFIGRSNVGKSSLINMLCKRKNLAKTSATPGKTQQINHFLIDDAWYLVDLPGYGFAKASRGNQLEWIDFVNKYLMERENLMCVFQLVDIRLEPQQIDLDFSKWLGANHIPFAIVFTKSDKLKVPEIKRNVEKFKQKMLEEWENLPELFITSAAKHQGGKEILDYINNIINSEL